MPGSRGVNIPYGFCVSTSWLLRSRSASRFESDGLLLAGETVKSLIRVDQVGLLSRVCLNSSSPQSSFSRILLCKCQCLNSKWPKGRQSMPLFCVKRLSSKPLNDNLLFQLVLSRSFEEPILLLFDLMW